MSAQERQRIWSENQAMALVGLAKIPADQDVAILVLDTTDPVGEEITRAAAKLENADLRAHQKKTLRKGMIPTAIFIVDRLIASKVMSLSSPQVASYLRGPCMEGGVWVVVVAHGASSLLMTRRTPIATEGST